MDSQETETKEYALPPQLVDLTEKEPDFPDSSVLIPKGVLGYQLWEEALSKTVQDKYEREYGFVVSARGDRIKTSGIITGDKHSINPDLILHGFASFLPGLKDILIAHTHPVTHLPATFPSDGDVQVAFDKPFSTLIIETGGVHLLANAKTFVPPNNPPPDIVDKAITAAENNSRSTEEVRKIVAKALRRYGLIYYFSEDPKPNQDGNIQLDLIN